HSSQMYTLGPAISFLTCFWLFPQNEHFNRSAVSMRATATLLSPDTVKTRCLHTNARDLILSVAGAQHAHRDCHGFYTAALFSYCKIWPIRPYSMASSADRFLSRSTSRLTCSASLPVASAIMRSSISRIRMISLALTTRSEIWPPVPSVYG